MSESLKVITDGWNQLSHSPLWIVLGLVTLCIGLFFKSLKIFPNRFIPCVTLPFCTIAYAMMGNPGDINPGQPYPRVMLGFYGLILAFGVWAFHRVLFKQIEKRFPWMQPALQDFDSIPSVPLPDGSNTKPPVTPKDP